MKMGTEGGEEWREENHNGGCRPFMVRQLTVSLVLMLLYGWPIVIGCKSLTDQTEIVG